MLNLGVTAAITPDGLAPETRHHLARKVVSRLQASTRYHGETLPLEQVMQLQAARLARHIEGKQPYETYVLPW
jgi:CRISPR-associated protein Cas1